MQLETKKQSITQKIKVFFAKNKKIILIIGGIVALGLIVFLVIQLFQDRRTVKENEQYIIEYDRSDGMYIVSPQEDFSQDSLTEIFKDLQELCEDPEDIDGCTLFNLPGISLGTLNEELKQIQESEDETQKVIDDIKSGKKSFGSYEQTPTEVD